MYLIHNACFSLPYRTPILESGVDVYYLKGITVVLDNASQASLSRLDDGTYFLYNVYTRKNKRGKGIMKRLLQSILNDLPKGSTITLKVERNNIIAIHLYKSLGFKMCDNNIMTYTR